MPNDTFAVVLPTPGPGAYATTVNAAIEEIRDKLEPKVPVADMEIDQDFPMSNHAITDVGYLEAQDRGAAPVAPLTIYIRSGDWYCKDSAGNEIRISSGGALAAPVTDINGAHGARFVQAPAELLAIITGAPINFTNGKGVGSGSGACSFFCPMPVLRRGDRILSVIGTFGCGVGAGTSSINLKRRNADGLAPTTLGSNSSGATGAGVTCTISGLTEVIGSGLSYVLEVNTGRSQDSFETITVQYDRP